jgi:Tol biopolymer transport system component
MAISGSQMAFTKDGNWLLYHDVDAAGNQSLFRVATAGGQPERIGDFPSAYGTGYMWISPDGKKIIADTLKPLELWILENFEPAAPKQ